jgi:putative oxidoreductase
MERTMRDLAALLGRLLLSAIFIQAGYGKLIGVAAATATIAKLGLPVPHVTVWLTIAVELGCGLAVLVGFRTRWAALVLAVFCVATAYVAHYHPEDHGQMIHFMKNIAITGGFLQLVAFGPGRFALSRR